MDELVIAGRRPLPPGPRPWSYELDHAPDDDEDDDEDGEADDHHHDDLLGPGALVAFEPPFEDAAFRAEVTRAVGFVPAAVIVIRPASWIMSELAAHVIAEAIEGVVYARAPRAGAPAHRHDARGHARHAHSLDELEERLEAAYEDPRPLLAKR